MPVSVMPPHSYDAPGGRHLLTVSHSPASFSPPLSQRLPEDVWTHARRDVMHHEPSGPHSWSRARVYFLFYIISSMFECVTADETGLLDCLAFSNMSQNKLCCTLPGTKKQNML